MDIGTIGPVAGPDEREDEGLEKARSIFQNGNGWINESGERDCFHML